MSATILIIDYVLGDAQSALPPEAWQQQARQIASIPGLRWKCWFVDPDGDGRGGVYMFDTASEAESAAGMLIGSLRDAGARATKHRILNVDAGLSAITRAPL